MKKKILSGIISFILVSFIILSTVYAASQSELNSLRNKKAEAEREKAAIGERKGEAQTELDLATEKVNIAQDELNAVIAEIDGLNNDISSKERLIKKTEDNIETKTVLLKERMVALYEAGDTSYLDVLLNSEDLFDFIASYSMMEEIAKADNDLIEDLEAEKVKLENIKQELETKKAEVEEKKKEQEEKTEALKQMQAEKQSIVNNLSAEEKSKQIEIDAYNSSIASIEAALAEAARRASQQMGSNGINFDGYFIWPCNNKIVTSRMKYRWGRWHKGIDIGASYEYVYAAASGYAYVLNNPGGYGRYIIVFHGDGYVTLYGHLDSYLVSDGQYVKQGQAIAISGNTGSSTGPHLHFEIRRASSLNNFFGSNNWYNPLDYLPGGYTMWD